MKPYRNTKGQFVKGHRHSDKIKEKIRKAHEKKPLSDKHKINIGKALKGKKYDRQEPAWNKGKRGEGMPGWKGGISKDKQHYCRERKVRKLGADGFHTIGEWETLKAQHNWTCPACKRNEQEIKLTEDHIVPLIKGGSDNIENIQPLCQSCNSKKHTKIIKYE